MASRIIFIIFSLSRLITATKWTPVIQTTKGPIVGEILETAERNLEYSSFKGIPYANPPVGHLRFKPPTEKTEWTDTLQTISEGSICPQIDLLFKTFGGSENCLYLNVYTPETKFRNINKFNLNPVMVWFYGGSLVSGYANSSLYGPDFIVQEGIVLVTLNYRLGALGFLNLEHDNATGNAGLKDQNMALKWVKENIINFRGDPNKVTIFGQSAGSVSVDYHVLSNMSQGLFQRSISMSGSSMSIWGLQKPEDAVKAAFDLGEKLGIKTADKDILLKHLYESPADSIIKATANMALVFPPFRSAIENETLAPNEPKFLTECSKKKFTSGKFNKGPHMMGFVEHECNAYANFGYIIYYFLQALTDIVFISGIDEKQKLLYGNNDYPVYYYRISVDPKFSVHRYLYNVHLDGAAHADDILYLFYMHFGNFTVNSKSDHQVVSTRTKIVKMWTNFAKYGNPTPCTDSNCLLDLPTWPSSGKDGKYMEIGDTLSVVDKRPTNPRIDVYQSSEIGVAEC